MNVIIKIKCRDQIGIVANLSSCLKKLECNIIENSQFFQPHLETRRIDGDGVFFMRVEVTTKKNNFEDLRASIEQFGEEYDADVALTEANHILPVIIMVSKFDHCLMDILYRIQSNTLPINVVAVVSNHIDTRDAVERLGIPFYLWSVTKANKVEQEEKLSELYERTGAELIVLARYMQILSDDFCSKYHNKIINIHHSFLPAFKGAKPYHQAWNRGVKHIGATAHYVTPALDEGPIIEQDTQRISHSCDVDEMVRRGRDVEAQVLSRAIKLHAENRVFNNEDRTVIFYS